jgi:peptidylprolyl isomerase
MKTRSILNRAALGAGTTFVLAMAGAHAQGELRAYYANDPMGRNVAVIESRAPLETMVTTTGDIRADISIDPRNVLANPKARFEIGLDTLDTGIPARNDHMRSEKWLNTKQFPNATFVLTRVLAPTGVVPLQQGKTARGEVEGDLSLHGVTKKVRAQLEIKTFAGSDETKSRLPGDLMHIRATFPLALADFNIALPPGTSLKIAPIQDVTVDVFTSTGTEKPTLGAAAGAGAGAANEANTDTTAKTGVRTMDNGLQIEDVTVGNGAEAKAGQKVTVHYRGTLPDGKQFDASYDRGEPFEFNLGAGEVIKGWDQGVAGMKVGGKRKLVIPPALGYGARGAGGVIGPNATLHFEVELLKVS